jgi:hypothetical protein
VNVTRSLVIWLIFTNEILLTSVVHYIVINFYLSRIVQDVLEAFECALLCIRDASSSGSLDIDSGIIILFQRPASQTLI